MKTTLLSILVVLLCEWSLAQYDSPTPPRPVIPGALPAPRPQIRRIQGPPGGRALSPGIVRVRRPQQAARLPPPTQLDEEDFPPVRGGPPPLPPGLAQARPALPPGLAQARPAPPPESNLPPRPVEEQPDEEPEYDSLELEVSNPAPSAPPPLPPSPSPQPAPIRPQSIQSPAFRPSGRPAFRPERPIATSSRTLIEDIPVPTRQQFRQQSRPAPPAQPQYVQQAPSAPRRQPPQQQVVRQPPQQQVLRQPPPEQQQFPRHQKPRKPVSQVINKYRDDNPDGSITWGYENDDGTFKEETIGVDCMVRGKYGYIDPDGMKREYTYTSGIPCDKDKERENEGFIDYQNNKYVLANGDSIDLQASIKNKARRPVAVPNSYRN